MSLFATPMVTRKNEKEQHLLDVQFSTDKKLATTQDRQKMQNSNKSILSVLDAIR